MSNWKAPTILFAALSLSVFGVTAAQADEITDYYRASMKLRVCPSIVNTVTGNGNLASNTSMNALSDGEQEDLQNDVEADVVDINMSSDEIADIFAKLESERERDPVDFCRSSN